MAKESYKYSLEIKDPGMASLARLPKEVRRQIGYSIDLLQRDFTGEVKKLKGYPTQYRLRVGSYRVVFKLIGGHLAVYAVGDRKDIYAR